MVSSIERFHCVNIWYMTVEVWMSSLPILAVHLVVVGVNMFGWV